MSYIDAKVYSEVLAAISNSIFVYEKIPRKIVRFLEKNSHKSYEVKFPRRENILNFISKEAVELYVSLYIDYVATEREKSELKQILIDNEMKYRKSLESE